VTRWMCRSHPRPRQWDRPGRVPTEKDNRINTRPSTKDKMDKMELRVSSWELPQQHSSRRLSRRLSYTSSTSEFLARSFGMPQRLTKLQYVGRSDHTAPHLLVQHQRELRHVAIFRILKSSCVGVADCVTCRRRSSLTPTDNISNIQIYLRSYGSSTCMASTKVRVLDSRASSMAETNQPQ
jgi:hypothetical protein